MKKLLCSLLFIASAAAAQSAETYRVDPHHTQATFSFSHMGFSKFHGKIPSQSGQIVLDRAAQTGNIEVVFDLRGIATGVPAFDNHLRSKDLFEVEKYPTATFKAGKMTFKGEAPSVITGELTMKGMTKPVTLQVSGSKCGMHPMEKKQACGANATATIKRSEFGLGYALPAVPDEIELIVEVEAIAQ